MAVDTVFSTAAHNLAIRPKTINPFTDWGFKYLFGREERKPILAGFLNLLLEPEQQITDITYLNTSSIPDREDMKHSIFDVLCKDESGNQYLVEMQMYNTPNLANRLLYYACRLIDQMGQKDSKWDYDIQRVYTICLMDFKIASTDESIRHDYKICDVKTGQLFSDKLNIITLQIPRIKAKNLDECSELYEKMLYLLKTVKEGMRTKEEIEAEVNALVKSPDLREMFIKMLSITNPESLNEADRMTYDCTLKRYYNLPGELEFARNEGREQGKAEGLQEGLQQGLQEGKREGILATVRNLKAAGVDIAIIKQATGQSESEIQDL